MLILLACHVLLSSRSVKDRSQFLCDVFKRAKPRAKVEKSTSLLTASTDVESSAFLNVLINKH